MNENITAEKSIDFAVRIVNLHKYLSESKKEYVLSKQVLKSGTSIGANIHEAKEAQSGVDFISKLNIALKEASETEYWLTLLFKTNYITEQEFFSLSNDCKELIKILTSAILTKKQNLNKKEQ